MSRQQRLRQEKALQRAEIVVDKTEVKVAKSVGKGKAVRERSVCPTATPFDGGVHEKAY